MIPVESDFERDVLNLLLWAQLVFLKAAPRIEIRITKPLFALSTADGYCRPDFILDISVDGRHRRRLIIEALGFDTPEYEGQKAVTLPRMKLIGPLFEIHPPDLVDAMSLDLVGGATVDYVESLGGAAFRVTNPNAASGCGCGASFSV